MYLTDESNEPSVNPSKLASTHPEDQNIALQVENAKLPKQNAHSRGNGRFSLALTSGWSTPHSDIEGTRYLDLP